MSTTREKESFNAQHPGWLEGEEMTNYGNKRREVEQTNESHRQFLEQTLSTLTEAGDTGRAARVRQTLALHGGSGSSGYVSRNSG